MQTMAAKSALLRTLVARKFPNPRLATAREDQFRSGLEPWDELAPGGGWRLGAIHELLFETTGRSPKLLALLLGRAAQAAMGGVVVWSDPRRELHPTALARAGIDLRRLILLRPQNAAQEISALAECLRCKGVSATLATVRGLSGIEARRLQLAVENGGGVGIFLRPLGKGSAGNYAAATRWLVRPALQDGDWQSWTLQLLHGHGGRLGASVLLEVDRETGDVRASAGISDRPAAAAPFRATA